MFKSFAVSVLLTMSVASPPVMAMTDPTQPSGYTPARSAQILTLDSVLISAQRRVAVINGKAVTVGERVAGATVVSIQPQRVVLQRAGKNFALTPRTQSIRRDK